MKLGIMQPYFFPYIGYFQLIESVDKFIIYDNLNYIKEGWMNKNKILKKNSDPIYIIVPLEKKSSYKKCNEIKIKQNGPWRKKMIKTIYFNYKKSSYFEEVFPIIENIINSKTEYLTQLNSKSIIEICNFLEIGTEITDKVDPYKSIEKQLSLPNEELVSYFSDYDLNYPVRKVLRVFEICKIENASIFINAIGGRELYLKKDFSRNGLEILFVKTNDIHYKQQSSVFFPHLSIIDVLMNCGKVYTQELLKSYSLV